MASSSRNLTLDLCLAHSTQSSEVPKNPCSVVELPSGSRFPCRAKNWDEDNGAFADAAADVVAADVGFAVADHGSIGIELLSHGNSCCVLDRNPVPCQAHC